MAIAHHQPAAATAPAADDWLAALNAQQRQAVLHGTGEGAVPGPLLVIAGAGTGKTDTLAHRVAHLVRQGADPQRILLLTFSRRAAGELEKRAGRVLARALGTGAGADADDAALGRHVPRRRRAPVARVRPPHRARPARSRSTTAATPRT